MFHHLDDAVNLAWYLRDGNRKIGAHRKGIPPTPSQALMILKKFQHEKRLEKAIEILDKAVKHAR